AIRDLLFGKNAYPLPEVPASIARPDSERLAPALPLPYEQLLSLLMNVLMIEVRAELAFDFVQQLLADPELFTDRRAEARLAHELVDCIRADESFHAAYLQLVLAEMRGFSFRAVHGGLVPGAEVFEPMWATLLHWDAVENPRLTREAQRAV